MAQATTRPSPAEPGTTPSDETILKMAKEIAVKFIEVGRITPTTFAENFSGIYQAIEKTVRKK